MYYEDLMRELNRKRVRYLVVGGVALVLHGIVRLTVDFDVMLDLSKKNLLRFLSAMDSLGYKPKVPVRAAEFIDPRKRQTWVREKNMKVFSFINPKKPVQIVDVFVENPIDFEKAYKSRKVVEAGRLRIPLVSVGDLKHLKRLSGRSQDIADLKALEEVHEK
ncbi:MAG: hypothetical protein FJY77_01335 [Candidatus Altiarchaeales archaeon]|nr:hypothetical protein [Candidatus Altiarchaeales archaeon]